MFHDRKISGQEEIDRLGEILWPYREHPQGKICVQSLADIALFLSQISVSGTPPEELPKKAFTEMATGSGDLEFEELKRLLKSDEWPEAVPSELICDVASEEDKMERAEGIIDISIHPLEGKRLLDFGCGEGHVAAIAVEKGAESAIGYDIDKQGNLAWEEEAGYLLTTDIQKIREKAPYDVILLYDVLDHADHPVEVLKEAKSLLARDGKISLRCHPWCGRHGAHLYQKKNKAFIHLIFNKKELEELGLIADKNQQVLTPIVHYRKWIQEAGLRGTEEVVERISVEPFFSTNWLIRKRISSIYPNAPNFPGFQLEQIFFDETLIC